MKRLVLCAGVCGLLAAMLPSGALGFAGNFDYVGHMKGNPNTFIGFFVKHASGGHRKVTGFTVSQIPYTCRDAPDGTTAGWRFDPKMRVKTDRTFFKTGSWTGLPLDPYGLVRGKLHRGGVATGEFKLNGELAGPDTHCHTHIQDWRATRQSGP
jgi:hypothetical protein